MHRISYIVLFETRSSTRNRLDLLSGM